MKQHLMVRVVFLLLLTGCAGNTAYSPSFDIGVIQTTGTKNKSIITFYQDDFTRRGSMAVPYGSMDYYGFSEPILYEGHLLVVPQGLFTKKDLGIVLDIDLSDGTSQKIEFDRINVTSADAQGHYVYAVSNLNQTVYLDRYDRRGRTIDSVKLEGWMLLYAKAHNGGLIGAGLKKSDGAPSTVSLLKFDFETGRHEELADLTPYVFESEPPIHILSHGEKVYMTSGDQLLIYCDQTKTIQALALPDRMAGQMLMDKQDLIILHSDIVGASMESSLTVLDLPSLTLENHPLGETVWQIAKKGSAVLGLDLKENAIHRYEMGSAGFTLEASQHLTPEQGFTLSAFFRK